MSASDYAIATIKMEHRSLGTVLQTLQDLLKKIAAGHAVVDFGLLSVALFYVDDFSERYHHPKEEEYLFKRMRLRGADFDLMLDRLQTAHSRSAQMVADMNRRLVRYQAGASDGLQDFRQAVDSYANDMLAHFLQEDELLANARSWLTEDDWTLIARAFAANDDPLFGSNLRMEFTQLYHRIILLAPRRMKPELRGGGIPPPP